MKVHTTAFKEQIKEMGRELDSIITYGDTVLGNEQLNAVTPSFQGGILKSVMKQLDIDCNEPIPVGTILNYKFGVKVDGEYEYLDFGNYVVKSVEKQEDTMSYKITCYDKLLFSMKEYAKMPITYPISVRDYINSLCIFLGLRFANSNETFVNYDKLIKQELYLDASGNDIGYTFRDVFDELAQVTASTICINDNDEVEIRYINDTGDSIDEEFLKNVNVNFGEKYGKVNSIVLSRSGESDNVYLRDEASVAENGLCELKIIDNQIMNWNDRDTYLPEILGKLNGLEYYLNDFASTGIAYYDLCDRYNVVVGDKTYSCVMLNDELLVTQGLEENVFTEMPKESETDYTKADKTDRKINQTYLIVDKQNQQIESVVSQTNEQNQKIAKVTQTVEELNSKISDVADITISGEDTDAQVELDKINQSEPIRIVVRPVGQSISYDYPHEDYPQEDFSTIRTIRFTNKSTGQIIDYELPDDLLYYDSENYDEFILDYDGQSCVINKKLDYDTDGNVYILDEPITTEYQYPKIELEDGDYVVNVLGYETAYIFVRLMSQNIYTTQFATRAEVNSQIKQTTEEIDLSVNKKLESYSTTTEMNSAIQLTANGINQTVSQKVGKEEVVSSINNAIKNGQGVIELKSNSVIIEADNFKLDKTGNIKATGGTIGGFGLSTNKFSANVQNTLKSYTQSDLNKLQQFILGNTTLTDAEKQVYDINGDGILNSKDLLSIQKIILGADTNVMNGQFIIDTKSSNSCLAIYDKSGKKTTSIGLRGMQTESLYGSDVNSKNITVKDFDNQADYNNVSTIKPTGITTPVLTQTSLAEAKKNFELLKSGLDIINKTDIYKYNLKFQKDNDKKHIGFIIGDEFNYSQEVTSQENNSVDLYSMIAVAWKSIQEQQAQIKQLKEEIKSLKESDK